MADFSPGPSAIPHTRFDIKIPNEVHLANLLFLPSDNVGRHAYIYELAITDVASHYKEAEALEASRAPGSRAPGSRVPGSRAPGNRVPGSRALIGEKNSDEFEKIYK